MTKWASQKFLLQQHHPEIDAEQKGTLSKVYLGKSKDCLDLIEVSVELNAAVNSFGPFIKFIVDSGVPLTRAESCTSSGCPSAFDILMSAQECLSLPKRIEKEKKELLYIDVIQKQDIAWNRFEVDGVHGEDICFNSCRCFIVHKWASPCIWEARLQVTGLCLLLGWL